MCTSILGLGFHHQMSVLIVSVISFLDDALELLEEQVLAIRLRGSLRDVEGDLLEIDTEQGMVLQVHIIVRIRRSKVHVSERAVGECIGADALDAFRNADPLQLRTIEERMASDAGQTLGQLDFLEVCKLPEPVVRNLGDALGKRTNAIRDFEQFLDLQGDTAFARAGFKLETDHLEEFRDMLLEVFVSVLVELELLAGRVLHIRIDLDGMIGIGKAQPVPSLPAVLPHNPDPGAQLALDLVGRFPDGKMAITAVMAGIDDDTLVLFSESRIKPFLEVGRVRAHHAINKSKISHCSVVYRFSCASFVTASISAIILRFPASTMMSSMAASKFVRTFSISRYFDGTSLSLGSTRTLRQYP